MYPYVVIDFVENKNEQCTALNRVVVLIMTQKQEMMCIYNFINFVIVVCVKWGRVTINPLHSLYV